jgi:hypothetical protein
VAGLLQVIEKPASECGSGLNSRGIAELKWCRAMLANGGVEPIEWAEKREPNPDAGSLQGLYLTPILGYSVVDKEEEAAFSVGPITSIPSIAIRVCRERSAAGLAAL